MYVYVHTYMYMCTYVYVYTHIHLLHFLNYSFITNLDIWGSKSSYHVSHLPDCLCYSWALECSYKFNNHLVNYNLQKMLKTFIGAEFNLRATWKKLTSHNIASFNSWLLYIPPFTYSCPFLSNWVVVFWVELLKICC